MKKKEVKENRRKSSSKKKSTKSTGKKKNTANYGQRAKKSKGKSAISLPSVEPWKIILGVIVAGLLGMAYLNHVFATQKLLGEVQQLEQQYNQAQRAHDSYRLMYDRMIGPAEISEKAKGLGFINGGPAEKVIEVAPE